MDEALPKIQEGDFVRVKINAKGSAWEYGTVEKLLGPDQWLIGYGPKNISPHLRRHGLALGIRSKDIEVIR